MTAFALILLAAAAAALLAARGLRQRAASYFQLAVVLYGAMAIAEALQWSADAVAAIGMSLGAVVLTAGAYTAFRRSPRILSASLILAAAGLSGIASAMLGLPVLAAVPQVLSALFALLIARKPLFKGRRSGVYLALAALALLGAAALQAAPSGDRAFARAGLMLFAAAGLAGSALASNLRIEEERLLRQNPSID